MKLYIKFLIFIVILACAGPFLLKRSDGSPWMAASNLKAPDLGVPDVSPLADEIENFPGPTPGDGTARLTTVYKWRDENGIWHFSNQSDPAHPGEEININNNINTVQMPAVEKHAENPRPYHSRNVISNETATLDAGSSPYGQLPELVDEAHNAGNLLDQHQKQQQQIIR